MMRRLQAHAPVLVSIARAVPLHAIARGDAHVLLLVCSAHTQGQRWHCLPLRWTTLSGPAKRVSCQHSAELVMLPHSGLCQY